MENITVIGIVLLLCNVYLFSIVLEEHFAKKKLSISVLSGFVMAMIFAFTSFSALNEYTYKANGIIVNAKIIEQKRSFGNFFSPSANYSVTYSFKDKTGFLYSNTTNIYANKLDTASARNDKIKVQYIYGNPYKNRTSTENFFYKYLTLSLVAAFGVIFCLYRKRIINLKVHSYLDLIPRARQE